jgi:hypothetical protein
MEIEEKHKKKHVRHKGTRVLVFSHIAELRVAACSALLIAMASILLLGKLQD